MTYPLAIMDYGIGGLGLLKLIKAEYPDLPIIYFSDSGEVPYGKLSANVLRKRVMKVTDHLFSLGAAKIVVACHSASSVILSSDDNIMGIRELTVEAVLNTGLQKVGVIGGGRTIRSGFYRKALNQNGVHVQQRIAQELSILVERGETDTNYVYKTVQRILRPLRDIDGLLLACTHYPVLKGVIEEVVGAEVCIVDPIEYVFGRLQLKILGFEGGADDVYITTGDVGLMQRAASNGFNHRIAELNRCKLYRFSL